MLMTLTKALSCRSLKICLPYPQEYSLRSTGTGESFISKHMLLRFELQLLQRLDFKVNETTILYALLYF